MVPEELEKHLILNSSRLGIYEDARREIVTYVEAQFELKNRDSKRSVTGLREHSDVWRSTLSLSSVEGKASSSLRNGCFKCDRAHFQRDCNASKNAGTPSSGKGNQSKSWSKSESSISGKGKGKENMGKPTGKSEGTKGAIKVSKGSGNGKTLKTGISDLENLNQKPARKIRNQV